ncbi:hypothetical protein ACIO3O_01795 [Streptomyces sp. NPDC087440]|uniref:hypothetical protein n=1 Tax=Streptomyces sp. NPDC087440 TaxID=3365790 RepID=UPI00382FA68D
MHQTRRRDRRPPRRAGALSPNRAREWTAAGADVVIVGLFSGKQKDFAALMDAAERQLAQCGVRVVGRVVQRRGVSHGGVAKMALPFSSRTLLSYGKVCEAAALCERKEADAAIFVTTLTERQQPVLERMLGCPAVRLGDVLAARRPGAVRGWEGERQ